jgi:hypothetical protein
MLGMAFSVKTVGATMKMQLKKHSKKQWLSSGNSLPEDIFN